MAVNGFRKLSEYTGIVDLTIERDSRQDYVKIARILNDDPEVKMAWIEHEFGIFGGERLLFGGSEVVRDGHYILSFLEEFDKPVGLTTHTVLSGNDP